MPIGLSQWIYKPRNIDGHTYTFYICFTCHLRLLMWQYSVIPSMTGKIGCDIFLLGSSGWPQVIRPSRHSSFASAESLPSTDTLCTYSDNDVKLLVNPPVQHFGGTGKISQQLQARFPWMICYQFCDSLAANVAPPSGSNFQNLIARLPCL